MKVYLDYLFLENLIIDFILLKETSYLLKAVTKIKRLIIASVFSSTYVVLMVYLKMEILNFAICKVALMVITVYMAFGAKSIKKLLKQILIFLLVSVVNMGTIYTIKNILSLTQIEGIQKILIYALNFLIGAGVLKYLWKIYERKIKEDDLIYDVEIMLGKQKYLYKGFVDTGNNVFSYTNNIPIVFAEVLDKRMINELGKIEKIEVYTSTLGSKAKKTAYIIPNVVIKKEKIICKTKIGVVFEDISLNKNKEYNMLLNYRLYQDKMGGIKI